jgi:hypothetical protein
LVVIGALLFSGCATLSFQKWPDDQQNVQAMIITISQQVGVGLRTGAITIDQSQMFLRQLRVLRREADELSAKNVLHEHWVDLHRRLDKMEEEINTTFATSGIVDEDVRSAVRILKLQMDLDNAINEGRINADEASAFRSKLQAAREYYIKITDIDGTPITADEKLTLARMLDVFTLELNKFQ